MSTGRHNRSRRPGTLFWAQVWCPLWVPQFIVDVFIPQTDPVTIQDIHGSTVRNAVHVWSNIPAVKRYFLCVCVPGNLEGHRLLRVLQGNKSESARERRVFYTEPCSGQPLCPGQGPPHKFWTSSRSAVPPFHFGDLLPTSALVPLSVSPPDEPPDGSHAAHVPRSQFPLPRLQARASPCTAPRSQAHTRCLTGSQSSHTEHTLTQAHILTGTPLCAFGPH